MADNNWFLNWQAENDVNIGFFDSALQGSNQGSVLSAPTSPNYGALLQIGAIGLKSFAEISASKRQVANIFTNIGRTEKNIEQIHEQLSEALEIQARKVSKRQGTQMARIGASGVAFSGSPLMVMAETHRRGMEDYEAIEKKGRYAIEDAYLSIYDQIDRAEDIGKAQQYAGISTAVTTGTAIATGFL
jgi:hypothetical protein